MSLNVQERPTTYSGYPDITHPSIIRLFDFIENLGDCNVSDVHIHPDKPVRRLVRGSLIADRDGAFSLFTQNEINDWIAYGSRGADNPLGTKGHASIAFDTGVFRVRATFRRSTAGITATFRLIPGEVPNADAIGVPRQIQNLTTRTSGLVMIEGPTGSGKTTLLAGLINKINHESDKHVYTVEDPIEFLHTEQGNSSIVQREIGTHASDYPTAIEDALRSKPNIILVGEILNAATAKAALHAATTGHLVFSTAHAGSITEALESFVGQFTADEQPQIRSRLSSSLLAIVVQKLIPTVDNKLVAAREVLINDANFAELIRTEQGHMVRSQIAGSPGCFTLENSLATLVNQGAISLDSARAHAKDPNSLENDLENMGLIEKKRK